MPHRDTMVLHYRHDPLPFKVVSFLWNHLSPQVQEGIINDGSVGETWPGMDYALWYAAHNNLPVPREILDEVEEEMNLTGDYCGLIASLEWLRLASTQAA